MNPNIFRQRNKEYMRRRNFAYFKYQNHEMAKLVQITFFLFFVGIITIEMMVTLYKIEEAEEKFNR